MSHHSPAVHSVLAESIRAFVDYKRALSRKYRNEAAALHLLDRYVAEQGLTALEQIDTQVPYISTWPRHHKVKRPCKLGASMYGLPL